MLFLLDRNLIKLFPIFLLLFSPFNFCQLSENSDEYEIYLKQYQESFYRGEEFLRKGDFQKSIESYEQSLEFAKKRSDKRNQVNCWIQLGLLYWNTGNLDKSIMFYNKAQLVAEEFDYSNEYSKSTYAIEINRLYQKGKASSAINNFRESGRIFSRAVKMAKRNNCKYHELKCLRQLSLAYWDLNELHKFHSLNSKCLEISQKLNHKKEIGKAYNNIGLYYWKTNDYSKALSYYQEALNIAMEMEDKNEISICMNNIGIIFKYLGFYTNASQFIQNSIDIEKENGNIEYLSMGLNNLGIISKRKAIISGDEMDYLTSLKHFKNCLEIVNEIGNINTEVKVLNNIGSVYLALNEYKNAIINLESGLVKSVRINNFEAASVILNNIGFAQLEMGRLAKAEDSFKQALDIGINKEALWEAYYGLGKCFESRNEFSLAIKNYKKAIDVIDHIRKGISVDIHKAGYSRDKLKVYESLVSLLFKLKNHRSFDATNEIFHVIESAKARAFLESLGESKIDISNRLTEDLRRAEMEISNRVSSGIRRLMEEDLSQVQRKEILREVKNAEDEYLLLISKMRVEVPEVASLVSPMPCNLFQVQNQIIDENTALIEYFLGESQSFVFLITKKDRHLFELPGREKIRKSLKAYLKALSDQPKVAFKGLKGSERLCKELLPFLHKIPNTVENLVIVPDGTLYYLPFETLSLSTNGSLHLDNLLISKFKISYSPSSSSLLFLMRLKRDEILSKDLLAFGDPNYPNNGKLLGDDKTSPSLILKGLFHNEGFDLSPLPYSKKEVANISRFFTEKNKDIYTGDNASETTFKSISIEQYKIIHFACHGLLDEKIPLRSALVLSLSKDINEDGFLQVSEIYNLRIKSELVILSACQTARGRLENGEGVLGLPRIFFYAGARSVISTLWRIEDKSTARFMKSFYKYLTKGLDKSQSLRLAKIQMIKSGYSHPFYWAAFILNGEYSSVIF